MRLRCPNHRLQTNPIITKSKHLIDRNSNILSSFSISSREMDDEEDYLYGDTEAGESSRLIEDNPYSLAQLTPQQK